MKLTDRQLQVLTFISMFKAIEGWPPSLKQIGRAFGFTTEAAWDCLRTLIKKGVLGRDRYRHRSIRITPLGHETLGLNRNTLAIEAETMTAWEMVTI